MFNFLFLSLFIISPINQSEWSLRMDKDGIKVYTRTIEGSAFQEFKAETVIENRSLDAVLSVLLDVDNYETLFANVKAPKILKKEGSFYDIHYFIIEAPWPVSNRDAIYEQKTVVDKNGTHAKMILSPKPKLLPENSDMVRIIEGRGYWELLEHPKNTIKVVYQFHSEPGGNIPDWVANKYVVDHPFNTLINLKHRLKD